MKKKCMLDRKMNWPKKILLISITLFLALVILTVGSGAWLRYTGFFAGGGNVAIDWPQDDPYIKKGTNAPEELFKPFSDDGTTVTSKVPIVFRFTIAEYLRNYEEVIHSLTEAPEGCYPLALKGGAPWIGTWEDVPEQCIRWANNSVMPEGFCIRYRKTADSTSANPEYEFFPYYLWQPTSRQKVSCDEIKYELEDSGAANPFFKYVEISGVNYHYYRAAGFNGENLLWTNLQWGEIAASDENIWSNGPWLKSRPSIEDLDWSADPPQVKLQLRNQWLEIKNLTKQPQKNAWYYNEADGYFYYIGVIYPGQLIETFFTPPSFRGEPEPVVPSLYGGSGYSLYGQSTDAVKEAVATQWGLTFEPGSLGAKIFE